MVSRTAARREAELLERLAQQAKAAPPPAPQPRLADFAAAADPLAQGPDCPSLVTLERFAAGQLRNRATARVRQHLAVCPVCRKYVRAVRKTLNRPAPQPVASPREGLTSAHLLGLVALIALLILANTPLLDLLLPVGGEPAAMAAPVARFGE